MFDVQSEGLKHCGFYVGVAWKVMSPGVCSVQNIARFLILSGLQTSRDIEPLHQAPSLEPLLLFFLRRTTRALWWNSHRSSAQFEHRRRARSQFRPTDWLDWGATVRRVPPRRGHLMRCPAPPRPQKQVSKHTSQSIHRDHICALKYVQSDMFHLAPAFIFMQLWAHRSLPRPLRAVLHVSTTFQTTTISVFLGPTVTFPPSWWHKDPEPSTTSPWSPRSRWRQEPAALTRHHSCI